MMHFERSLTIGNSRCKWYIKEDVCLGKLIHCWNNGQVLSFCVSLPESEKKGEESCHACCSPREGVVLRKCALDWGRGKASKRKIRFEKQTCKLLWHNRNQIEKWGQVWSKTFESMPRCTEPLRSSEGMVQRDFAHYHSLETLCFVCFVLQEIQS